MPIYVFITKLSYDSKFGIMITYYKQKSGMDYISKEAPIDAKELFTKMFGPKQQNQIFTILLDNIYLEMMLGYQFFKAFFSFLISCPSVDPLFSLSLHMYILCISVYICLNKILLADRVQLLQKS